MTEQEYDECAVDFLAETLKHKLAREREKGRGGWHDENQCPIQRLAGMLVKHIEKGDPIDIAALCMMLHAREQMLVEHHPCYNGVAAQHIREAYIDALVEAKQ